MRKELIFIFGIVLLMGFVIAANNGSEQDNNPNDSQFQQIDNQEIRNQIQNQIANAVQTQNRLRINQTGELPEGCRAMGSVVRCDLGNGTRGMAIMAGKSGNMIIQSKGVNMTTSSEIYQSDGKVYGVFKGDQTKEIKYLPDEVQSRLKEKIDYKLVNEEDFEIELDEDGRYQVEFKKEARLFGFIKVRERVRTQVDPETGETLRVRNSWWGFLARDVPEELVGTHCGTVSPDSRGECCINKNFDGWDEELAECI